MAFERSCDGNAVRRAGRGNHLREWERALSAYEAADEVEAADDVDLHDAVCNLVSPKCQGAESEVLHNKRVYTSTTGRSLGCRVRCAKKSGAVVARVRWFVMIRVVHSEEY